MDYFFLIIKYLKMKKEKIIKNLLNKTFNKSFFYLENRTSEQLNSLQMTDKQFIYFNK